MPLPLYSFPPFPTTAKERKKIDDEDKNDINNNNNNNNNNNMIEVGEFLLLFGAESFIFQFAIQKVKDQDIQNCNIAPCSVWVWNLVADTEGWT